MARLGIDCDGVLVDFNKAYIELIKEISGEDKFGPGYKPTTWSYPETVGYSAEVVSEAWAKIEDSSSFWFALEPLDGMHELVEWLGRDENDIKHDVYFITSRPGKMAKLQSEAWFAQYDLPSTVLVSSEKGMCCEALKIDLYVDDKIENIMQIMKRAIPTAPYLLNQPWNQNYNGGKRIASLEEFFRDAA